MSDPTPTDEQKQYAKDFMNMATDVVQNESKNITYHIGSGGLENADLLHWGRFVERILERLNQPVPQSEENKMVEYVAFIREMFGQQEHIATQHFKRKLQFRKFNRNWYFYEAARAPRPKQTYDPDNPRGITHSTSGDVTFFQCEGQVLSTAQVIDILDYAVQKDLLNHFYMGQLIGIRKRSLFNAIQKDGEQNAQND